MNTALILGSAASLLPDLDALAALGPRPGAVIAVNRAGSVLASARIDHWVSLHPEQLGGFMAERLAQERGLQPNPYTTWCQREHPGTRVDVVVRSIDTTGSSGLFATRIALRILGCARVVLAGVPIDDRPHVYDTDGRLSGPGFVAYRPEWVRAQDREFEGRVRSLSGWTAERLGVPDAAWLAGA